VYVCICVHVCVYIVCVCMCGFGCVGVVWMCVLCIVHCVCSGGELYVCVYVPCVYILYVSVRCSINLQVCCCGCPHKEVYEQHLQGKKHLRVGMYPWQTNCRWSETNFCVFLHRTCPYPVGAREVSKGRQVIRGYTCRELWEHCHHRGTNVPWRVTINL